MRLPRGTIYSTCIWQWGSKDHPYYCLGGPNSIILVYLDPLTYIHIFVYVYMYSYMCLYFCIYVYGFRVLEVRVFSSAESGYFGVGL